MQLSIMKNTGRHFARGAAGFIFGVIAIVPAVGAPRPTEFAFTSIPGFSLTFKNVQWAQDSPENKAMAASGKGQIQLKIFGKEGALRPAAFRNVALDDKDKAKKDAVAILEDKGVIPDILGSGIEIELPTGTEFNSPIADSKLDVKGALIVRLPFRFEGGAYADLQVTTLSVQAAEKGVQVDVKGAKFTGLAVQNGLSLLGFNLKASELDTTFKWAPEGGSSVVMTMPSAKLAMSLPGLLTEEDKPITLTVNNLKMNEEGALTFGKTQIDGPRVVKLANPADFELTIKGGEVQVTGGKYDGFSVTADLKLPPSVTDKEGKPVVISGIKLDADKGAIISVVPDAAKPLDLYWSSLVLHVKGFTVDLSSTANLPTVPDALKTRPGWMGVLIGSATLDLPPSFGGAPDKPTALTIENFYVETKGVSGSVEVKTGQIPGVAGFPAKDLSGKMEFAQNQITACSLGGTIEIPEMGPLGIGVGFTTEGLISVEVKPGKPLDLAKVGAQILVERGQVQIQPNGVTRLIFSGTLSFPGVPQMSGATIQVQDMGVDSEGKMYLPPGGWLTIPKPIPIDLKVCLLEARRIGFTTKSERFNSIILTGAVKFENNLPFTGEVEFEGLEIERDGNDADSLPDVKMGGITVAAQIPGVGAVSGTLKRPTEASGDPVQIAILKAFPDCYFGAASLQLNCLGGAGINVSFMISRKAWFVGGGAVLSGPGIPIPPPSPTSAPLIGLFGFHGGFGHNVAAKPGAGRIDTLDKLQLATGNWMVQAGTLLGSYVDQGVLWWGELTLTLGIPKFVVDVSGKVTFGNNIASNPKGYYPPSWWLQQDRTASAYINWNQAAKTFLFAGQMDLYLPARKALAAEIHGPIEMKIAPREKYLRIGWQPYQSPVTMDFKAIGKITKVKATSGMQIDFQNRKAGLFFSIKGKMLGGKIEGEISGDMELTTGSDPSGTGSLDIDAEVDFAVGTANGHGHVACKLNTPSYRNKLNLDGWVQGSVYVGKKPFGKKVSKKQNFDVTLP